MMPRVPRENKLRGKKGKGLDTILKPRRSSKSEVSGSCPGRSGKKGVKGHLLFRYSKKKALLGVEDIRRNSGS